MTDLLTVAQIDTAVGMLDSLAAEGDSSDETAHSLADAIHLMVLRAIATGEAEDPIRCARAAIRTLDVYFRRSRGN